MCVLNVIVSPLASIEDTSEPAVMDGYIGPCRESAHAHVDNDLPFELKALEAVLTHALLIMEEDAVNLHKQISPMLEKLSFKVSPVYCYEFSCKTPCCCMLQHPCNSALRHVPLFC